MRKINLHFHPFELPNGNHAVEKSDSKGKRKYLEGISSGLKIDGHGERMTERCIASFIEQAKSGDILLYADVHGIKATEDIGILVDAEILPNGDWRTSYRLYDELDDVGQSTLDIINKLWKQINGLAPYKTAKQKGFSIEGNIPDESGFTEDENGNKIIDEVILEGVVVVPRPSYQDSIANAVFKALGEDHILNVKKSISSRLETRMQKDKVDQSYYDQRWKYQDALDEEIKLIMESKAENKQERLSILLDEYKKVIIPFLLSHKDFFSDEVVDPDSDPDKDDTKINKNLRLLVKLEKSLLQLKDLRKEKLNKRK